MFNKTYVDRSTRVDVEVKDIKPLEASKVYGEMLKQFKENILDTGTFEALNAKGRWMIHCSPMTMDYHLTAKIRINSKDIELTKNITHYELRRINGLDSLRKVGETIRELVLDHLSREITIDCFEVLVNERKYTL